jgi:hypothetical protein
MAKLAVLLSSFSARIHFRLRHFNSALTIGWVLNEHDLTSKIKLRFVQKSDRVVRSESIEEAVASFD